jgi:hypothetical protein
LSLFGAKEPISVSPGSIDFGKQPTSVATEATVTITNSGDHTLEIRGVSLIGSDAFTLTGWSGQLSVGPSEKVELGIGFKPNIEGKHAARLTIFTGAGTNRSVEMIGVGATASISISPTATVVPAGSSRQFTATVSDSASSEVTWMVNGKKGGDSLVGTISATGLYHAPSQIYARDSVVVTATDGMAHAHARVTIVPDRDAATSILSANPPSVDFGNVLVDTTGSLSITLTNSGPNPVQIYTASAAGAGFSIGSMASQTLNANESTSLTAKFAPTSAGNSTGSISIASDAADSPLTIVLTGIGTEAQLSSTPASVTFGSTATGNTNSQTINLKNSGNASVTISQMSVTGAGFSTTGLSTPATVAAGANTVFNVLFAPASAGNVNGSVSLFNTGPRSPLVIPLAGLAMAAIQSLTVSPTTLIFGNVVDGTSTSQIVTLTNNGNSTITISTVGITGSGFSTSGVSSGLQLAPGQTAPLSVTFDPSSIGAVSGLLTIASSATNSPATVSVSGTGVNQSSVTLSWNPSTSSGVVGYNVYRGTSSASYLRIASEVVAANYTDATVQSGQDITYYYVVTAVNASGEESPDSNQASLTVP